MSSDFLGKTKNFQLVTKCIYKLFLYGNHPNGSLIMKVIDQIMVHLRIMKIHRNLPGDIPNIFPYQNSILLLRNCIHKKDFCMVATLMVHPRIMKIHKNLRGATLMVHSRIMKTHKNLLGDIPNIFPYQHFILSLRNCIHK